MTGTSSALFRITPALLATAALAACGGAARGAAPASPQPAAHAQGDEAAVARARADSARHPYTAADIHFMSAMIGHHSQAVTIARWAPTHGAGAAVRTLAERIVNGQVDEIATMQRWLRDRQQPVPEAHATGAAMAHGAGHEMHGSSGMPMPGMLTEAQLERLDQARGEEFDRLFLTFMIRHHEGALDMVEELFAAKGAGQDEDTFRLASDVFADQTTEIRVMKEMLAARQSPTSKE